MQTHPENHGGTINADFQCSRVNKVTSLKPGHIVTVHNACKDCLPQQYWVCVCLPRVRSAPGPDTPLRYIYIDARHFGWGTRVCGIVSYTERRVTSKHIREFMALQLHTGNWDYDTLWSYAVARDAPRVER